MTNKCRIKMVQRELYNVNDPLGGKDQKNKKENTIAIKIILVFSLVDLYKDLPPRTMN